jgi:hypothetical protein
MMSRKTVVSLALGVSSLLAATLLAAGLLSPWTSEDGKYYKDAEYLGASANIEAFVEPAGSGSEMFGSGTEPAKPIQVRVTLPAGAGSLTEEARFVAKAVSGSATPQKIDLFPADTDWKEVGSTSEGSLEVETWDKTALNGKLFGYDLNALPEDVEEDTGSVPAK